mmetsp:Transcript_1332/g.1202  ORF Transcript_1332/g.1202 Transcript_1332/m.1202 type:complete len:132 (+) Transcript_1332:38-433(+)
MSYSQKKSQKPGYGKSKGIDQDRWDHGGFDRLQAETEDRQFPSDNSSKGRKGKRSNGESTMIADHVDGPEQSQKQSASSKKWVHDKYDSKQEGTPLYRSDATYPEEKHKSKKERKPDRQLYNPRQKHQHQD